MNKIWAISKSSVLLWTCRLFCFVWMYMYHDFQSLPILLWFLHSTLYKDSVALKKWMTYLYLPLFTAVFRIDLEVTNIKYSYYMYYYQ